MPEYLSPGVYIEEVNKGTRPIEGVGTAMAAFVGFAPAGPANTPVLVTNWSQYVDTFGAGDGNGGRREPHLKDAYLSHAVYGYFNNGGGRCYVVRVTADGVTTTADGARASVGSGAQKPTLQLPARTADALPSLSVSPKGTPASDIEIEIAPPTADDAGEGAFTFKAKAGPVEESFENVSLARKGPRYVVDTVNQQSKLLLLTELKTQGSVSERAPALGTYSLTLPGSAQVATTTSAGLPAKVKSASFIGDVSQRSGLEGFEIAEDVTMVCCPDLMSAYQKGMIDADGVKAVQLGMINHCERMKNRVAIIDPLPGLTPQDAKKWREKDTNFDSPFAAAYYPWIKVDGPDSKPIEIPPCGHIAGVFARNDNERGVHKAPANEVVRGALGTATTITKGEQDTLNPVGVNCIRSFTGRGIRVWGARTLSSDPQWRYVNVRRLFNYVEESIERGTQWVVFEPNDADLWARVRRDVGAFLTGVWREGMLFGATPQQAFYVKCDEELNPVDVRDRGQLIIEVGMAPVKPAEFVVFRFSQFAGGGA
jgi:Bacteriophage tail sheath protein